MTFRYTVRQPALEAEGTASNLRSKKTGADRKIQNCHSQFALTHSFVNPSIIHLKKVCLANSAE